MTGLGEIFTENAARFPDKEAVVFGGARLTYLKLNERINRLAWALKELGLAKGDRAATLSLNCHQYLEVYGATAKMGYVHVPLNFRLKGRELSYLMNNSGASLLLVGRQYEGMAKSILPGLKQVKHLISFDGTAPDFLNYEVLLESAEPKEPPPSVGLDDLAYIVYTSGTTGLPKGAMLTHGGQMVNTELMVRELKLTEADVVLVPLPLFHVGSLSSLLPNLYAGAKAIIMSSFDPVQVLKALQEEKVTNLHIMPTMIIDILNHPDLVKYDTSSLKTLMYAGGPMPLEYLKKALEAFGPVLMGFYGQTESGPTTSYLKREEHRLTGPPEVVKRLGSAGRPVPEAEVKVVDEEDGPLPPGQVGEIVIRGKSLMKGYWQNAEATAEAFKGGWLHTGDLAYTDEAGYLFIVDRKKDMIKSGGENIYPREVEEVIYTHPAVAEVAVIGVPHPRWGETVKAQIVLKSGKEASEEEIIEHCKTFLASYKKPTSVEFVESLPKNPAGKILKKEIREKYWKGYEKRIG